MSSKQDYTQMVGDNWTEEGKEIISGASGGFLFGVPLLYTMEVWFIGSYVEPEILLGILSITFVIILMLNRIEGFRPQESETMGGAIAETVETFAIAIVCATLVLIVLQRIKLETPLSETLGKIVFEVVPCCFGVAFSRSILSGETQIDSDYFASSDRSFSSNKLIWRDTLADLITTLIGIIFIAFSIAPTDEVTVLAAAASPPWLIIIIFFSLIISYGIVFAAGFTNQNKRRQQQGIFQKPQSETLVYYLVSLLISALMLWFFHKLTFADPWLLWLKHSIILSLPASIGGAAGRLAV